ncbi:MAG: hypothetical protein CMH64_02520 [Nanoarchaeota archaeon]|nr:hypothetical protein [Nanoarchaeota archaeon]|tara:strand:- start:3101 stop:3589 length:489 start_codon:yes stop_codon:yes gene_type:complete
MHLRLLILKLLKEGERTGYDLIKIIEKESGWKPSPGSMYPHLSELKKKHLIKVKEDGRKKLYFITAKGVKDLKKMKGELGGMMEGISKKISVFENLFGMKFGLSKPIGFVLGELKKGKIPFGQLGKDMMKFRVLFLKKAMEKKNHNKMHKIVKDAHNKLEKV